MYERDDPTWDRYFDDVLVGGRAPGTQVPTLRRRPVRDWQDWWAARAASTDPIVHAAAETGFLLSRQEYGDLGVTRARARYAIRSGRWTSAGYGFVAPVDIREPTDPLRPDRRDVDLLERRRRHTLESCGDARRRPGSTVSARSCAIVRGLPTMGIPRVPELTVRDAAHGRRGASHLYSATLPAPEREQWYGIDVETIGRTLVTLARHGRRDAIMAADAALREGLIDRAGIARALDTAVGWPWVRQARAVLDLADPRAESPLESITRLAVLDAGFPPPDLQVSLEPFEVDLYWARQRLVLEVDGAGKYVGRAWTNERERERILKTYAGVDHIERVVWADIVETWPATERRLSRYFRQ